MNLTELKKKSAADLIAIAQDLKLEGMARSRKQDVIFAILKALAKNGEDISGDGVLEIRGGLRPVRERRDVQAGEGHVAGFGAGARRRRGDGEGDSDAGESGAEFHRDAFPAFRRVGLRGKPSPARTDKETIA